MVSPVVKQICRFFFHSTFDREDVGPEDNIVSYLNQAALHNPAKIKQEGGLLFLVTC